MLLNALRLVQQSLQVYLEQHLGDSAGIADVVLGNVASLDQSPTNALGDKLIISLVNIEEERSLKNARTVRPNGLAGQVSYHNPPVSLNLYLLFSANYENSYENAIQILSLVLTFFQAQSTFTVANTPGNGLGLTDPDQQNLRLTFNLYTMTFEQLNHLWGALGGKQLPSALYRVYLVQLEDEQLQGGGRLIEQVEGNETML